MDILGIGPLELLLIVLLGLIIFGPKDLEKAGKSIGTGLRKLTKSDSYKTVVQASDRLRSLPTELMRQAGIDELEELKQTMVPLQQDLQKIKSDVQKPAKGRLGESWLAKPENSPADIVIESPNATEK